MLLAQPSRNLDLHHIVLHAVGIELLEDRLEVDRAAGTDNEVILHVEHAHTVGILLQVGNGILATLGAPIDIQLEEYVARVGMLDKILPHHLVRILQLGELARMVVVAQLEAVLRCDLADTVEVVTHLLHTLLRVVDAVARDNDITAAARLLYLEDLAPARNHLILLCGVLLYTRVGRDDLHAVTVTDGLELRGRKSEHLGVAAPLHKLRHVVTHVGQTLDRTRRVLLYGSHHRIELNADLLFLCGRLLRHGDHRCGCHDA